MADFLGESSAHFNYSTLLLHCFSLELLLEVEFGGFAR